MKTIISVSLDMSLVGELQRISDERHRPVSHIVGDAIKDYLKRLQKSGRKVTVRASDQLEERERE